MILREAIEADIPQIQIIRNSVTENTLSDPGLVTDADCSEFISRRGKGWVCEIKGQPVGFAIVDLVKNNVWALFVHPDHANKGVGRQLHDTMLEWYFNRTTHTLWLGTEPHTRAEGFYRKAGWTEAGTHGNMEIRFEMTHEAWLNKLRSS